MKKILLVDYLGQCDQKGNPVGHGLKTMEQYGQLLGEDYEVDALICENYLGHIEKKYFNKIYTLDNKLQSYNSSALTNMKNKISNLKKVATFTGYDVVIFINIDFSLGLVIKGISNKNNIISITYMDSYKFGSEISKKIKNYLFKKVLKYSQGIITSSEIEEIQANKLLIMPDFIYLPSLYDKYRSYDKKEVFLSVGTLSKEKDIESVVDIFINRNEKLKIIGKFYDEKVFHEILQRKTSNIEVENRIVGYDEYYELIASSKYVILPYKREFYKARSSGVLLETIFLGSIPMAPDFLLEDNEVEGYGYKNISELGTQIDKIVNEGKLIDNNIGKYGFNTNRENLVYFINNISK